MAALRTAATPDAPDGDDYERLYGRAVVLAMALEGLSYRAQHASLDADEIRGSVNPLWGLAVDLLSDVRYIAQAQGGKAGA